MDIKITSMTNTDRNEVVNMMRVFYSSPAVFTNGSEEIFESDFDACIGESPYLEGYVIEDGKVAVGYAMLAKSFSTEFGKPCIWIEDIYLKNEFRGFGIGEKFFNFIYSTYTDCIFRLEVEEENERAMRLYKKCGFDQLPYVEMKK